MNTYTFTIELKADSFAQAWDTVASEGFPRDFTPSNLSENHGYLSVSAYEQDTGREFSVTFDPES